METSPEKERVRVQGREMVNEEGGKERRKVMRERDEERKQE